MPEKNKKNPSDATLLSRSVLESVIGESLIPSTPQNSKKQLPPPKPGPKKRKL